MTRATRPTPPVVACDWVLSMVAVISSLAPRRDERIRAADDLTDFLGDFGLPGRVGQAGVRPDQFLGVIGRRLARTPARGKFRSGPLQQRVVNARLDIPR